MNPLLHINSDYTVKDSLCQIVILLFFRVFPIACGNNCDFFTFTLDNHGFICYSNLEGGGRKTKAEKATRGEVKTMNKFDGALIKEQGVTFAIILVKPSVLHSSEKESVRNDFSSVFGYVPTILASQTNRGMTYDGRKDIVKFLANIHPGRIPWKKYTIS